MSLDNIVYQLVTSSRRVVTTAGTAVTLTAAATDARRVDITAETDNTGKIAVGGSTVVAAEGTQQGVILEPGQTYTLHFTDLVRIFIDSTVNGDGVTFTYFN